jgi:hypothetical protein
MTAPTAPQKAFSIAVAGGGIAGLALAIGLRHQGVPVHIYEAAPAFAEVGVGVAFGRNAMRAMSLIDPAIEAGFQRRATTNGWKGKQKTWFDFRYGMDSRNGNGKRVEEVEETDGGVRLRFYDGTSASIPLLLGVTGLRAGRGRLSGGREGRRVRRFLRGSMRIAGWCRWRRRWGCWGRSWRAMGRCV